MINNRLHTHQTESAGCLALIFSKIVLNIHCRSCTPTKHAAADRVTLHIYTRLECCETELDRTTNLLRVPGGHVESKNEICSRPRVQRNKSEVVLMFGFQSIAHLVPICKRANLKWCVFVLEQRSYL